MSELESSFDDADLEIAQEINYEPNSEIEVERRLYLQSNTSQSGADQFKGSPQKRYLHHMNGVATSPQGNSYMTLQTSRNQLSSKKVRRSFNEQSFQTRHQQIKVMPLPEKEYTWKDGLRGQTSSHTKNLSIGCSSRNMSFMSVPLDISKIEGTEVHERLYKEDIELRRKREEIYDPNKKERIEEQTFSFSPNRLRDSNSYRSATQFLQDQKRLQIEKEERLELLRVAANEQAKIVPARRIGKEEAEQTKARVKQKFEQNKQKIIKEVVPEFKPKIDKNSVQMVTNRKINRVESPTKQVEQQQITTTALKNKKSENLVYVKFKRVFEQVIVCFGGSGKESDKETALQVLTALGFVIKTESLANRQAQLAEKLIQLGLSDKATIRDTVLLQLLCEIQQFHQVCFKEPLISKGQLLEFYPLVINRKMFLRNLKIEKATNQYKTEQQKEETLSPRLNTVKNAQILSQAKLIEMKGRLTTDQKVKTEILSTAHNRENLQWIKKQLDELEMLDCTFKPKTNARVFSQPRVYDEPLFRREDRRVLDIEFENQERECTFKPVINHRKQAGKYVPGSKGDVVSPGKPKVKQPSQQKSKKDKEEQEYLPSQLIQLNVRISDVETKQLAVRSADNFELIVKQFCENYGLDFEQEQTLISVISQNSGWPTSKQRSSV